MLCVLGVVRPPLTMRRSDLLRAIHAAREQLRREYTVEPETPEEEAVRRMLAVGRERKRARRTERVRRRLARKRQKASKRRNRAAS